MKLFPLSKYYHHSIIIFYFSNIILIQYFLIILGHILLLNLLPLHFIQNFYFYTTHNLHHQSLPNYDLLLNNKQFLLFFMFKPILAFLLFLFDYYSPHFFKHFLRYINYPSQVSFFFKVFHQSYFLHLYFKEPYSSYYSLFVLFHFLLKYFLMYLFFFHSYLKIDKLAFFSQHVLHIILLL